jgi:uncharacterized protein YlxW (UPF0749 family)
VVFRFKFLITQSLAVTLGGSVPLIFRRSAQPQRKWRVVRVVLRRELITLQAALKQLRREVLTLQAALKQLRREVLTLQAALKQLHLEVVTPQVAIKHLRWVLTASQVAPVQSRWCKAPQAALAQPQ